MSQEESDAMADVKKCDHPACNCTAPKDEKYCSAYCHDAGDKIELACNCGHPGCADEMTHRA